MIGEQALSLFSFQSLLNTDAGDGSTAARLIRYIDSMLDTGVGVSTPGS